MGIEVVCNDTDVLGRAIGNRSPAFQLRAGRHSMHRRMGTRTPVIRSRNI